MKLFMKTAVLIGILLSTGTVVSADCIGLVTAGYGSYWDYVIKGANQAGKELGIQIYSRGAADEANVEGQQYIINKIMHERQCRGLVLAPNSKDRVKRVAQLKAQGIPSVYIDRDMGGDRISVIKTNNALAGELVGREMAKALKGKGKIALLRLKKGVLTTDLRESGFIKAAVKGGLEIVIDEYLGTRIGSARQRAYQILKELKDKEIDGIFTPNDVTTVGVILALKSLKKEGTILHIGFDAHPVVIESLKANELYGFIVQQPYQMGYQGVYAVYKAMQGKSVKEEIVTDAVFVNRDNITNAKIREVLGLN